MGIIFDEKEDYYILSRSLLGDKPSKGKMEKYKEVFNDTTVTIVKGTSWYMSVFLIINSMLNVGVLNISAVYNTGGGMDTVIPLQFIVVPIIIGSMFILAWCSDLNNSDTYEDVILAVCGKRAKIACACALVVTSFGTLVGTFVVVGDQWDKFLRFAYGPTYCRHWYMRRSFTMAMTCTSISLPFCYAKRIDFLKYSSVLGVAAVWYTVLLVTVKYFIYGPQSAEAVDHLGRSWTDVFHSLPVICFCFQCSLSIIPIYSCFEKRNMGEFAKAIFTGFAVVMVGYTSTAVFGFLTFGVNINQDILLSYKPITVDILIALILIAFKMYANQPILVFVGRAATNNIWIFLSKLSTIQIEKHDWKRRVTIVTIWFLCAVTVATIIPNIGVVLKFLGGFNSVFTFILPGICLMTGLQKEKFPSVTKTSHYRLLMVVSLFYIIFGVFLFGLGISQAVFNGLSQITFQPTPQTTTCP